MDKNYQGIIVTGGRFEAKNVVAGEGGIIIDLNSKEYENIDFMIKEVLRLLHENEAQLSNFDELSDSVSAIDKELKKIKPNKITIRGTLSELASAVSSVSTLAEAVAALRAVVLGVL